MMISYLKTNYRTKVLNNIDFCAIIYGIYSLIYKIPLLEGSWKL